MTDVLTKAQRSYCMSRIRSRDTKPEIFVRRMVHRMGFRPTFNDKKLPGRPDLVFRKYRKVIFVHGCFWHFHHCRYGIVKPATNRAFWRNKRLLNRERDHRNTRSMNRLGWRVLTIWECWIRKPEWMQYKISKWLVSDD